MRISSGWPLSIERCDPLPCPRCGSRGEPDVSHAAGIGWQEGIIMSDDRNVIDFERRAAQVRAMHEGYLLT